SIRSERTRARSSRKRSYPFPAERGEAETGSTRPPGPGAVTGTASSATERVTPPDPASPGPTSPGPAPEGRASVTGAAAGTVAGNAGAASGPPGQRSATQARTPSQAARISSPVQGGRVRSPRNAQLPKPNRMATVKVNRQIGRASCSERV